MALAYCILAHKQPGQLIRLVRALHHPADIILLHVDARAPAAMHQAAASLSQDLSGVEVMPSRPIVWGGSTMIETQIAAMDLALRRHVDWTHFINLTAQDFPLKTRSDCIQKLGIDPTASYLSWFDPLREPIWKNARERLDRYYIEWPWLDRLLRVPGLGRRLRRILGWSNTLPRVPFFRRRWPDFFHYYGGSNYVVLSRAAAAYVARDVSARRIRHWLRASAHADEIVFQTVLLNSSHRTRLINNDLREIDFPRNAPHPRTFTHADLPRLRSSTKLFARKFDESVDSEVLTQLERNLLRSPAHS